MSANYQRLLKEREEQLGGQQQPPAPGSSPPNPSFDPRDSMQTRSNDNAPAVEGGTPLSMLYDQKEPPAEAMREEAVPEVQRELYYERPMYEPQLAVELPVRNTADEANRRLRMTVFLICITLFAPPLQAKLSEFLPRFLVFDESWQKVVIRAIMTSAAFYAFRRFLTSPKAQPMSDRSPMEIFARY